MAKWFKAIVGGMFLAMCAAGGSDAAARAVNARDSLEGGLPPPHVVASIKPVHALVAGVMEGVGSPGLLIQGNASPHAYTLRPSDAKSSYHRRL